MNGPQALFMFEKLTYSTTKSKIPLPGMIDLGFLELCIYKENCANLEFEQLMKIMLTTPVPLFCFIPGLGKSE